MALTPGVLLAGRYRLTGRIAVGGMGQVWSGTDQRLGRDVAVKILRPELSSDPAFVERFRAEARMTASLNHPGIAAVYDYGETAAAPGGREDTAYLVMELVAGESLSAVLARVHRLPVARTLDVLEQSGRALQVAHARFLVHRDIKPGNLLVTPTGQVKITDFGIAKVADQTALTGGGMVLGTAQYLSPEQATGREATPASDVYALGVLAYECLAGARPFIADTPVAMAFAQVNAPPPPLPGDVPPPAAALVMRMLAKNPARRFPDGGALAAAVAQTRRQVLAGAVAPGPAGPRLAPLPAGGPHAGGAPSGVHPGARPSGPVPAPPRPYVVQVTHGPARPSGRSGGRRRTGVATAIAVAVVLACAAAGVLVYRSTGAEGAPQPSGPVAQVLPGPAGYAHNAQLVVLPAGRAMEQWSVERNVAAVPQAPWSRSPRP